MKCPRYGSIRLLSSFVVGVAILGPVPGHTAPPVNIQSVTSAAIPTVKVTPTKGASVTVPSCRGVVWERFDPRTSEYTPISTRPCKQISPAVLLTEKGRTFEVDAPVQAGDVVRAVAVVGSKCEAGRPFELADCKTIVSVEGPTITVRGSGG